MAVEWLKRFTQSAQSPLSFCFWNQSFSLRPPRALRETAFGVVEARCGRRTVRLPVAGGVDCAGAAAREGCGAALGAAPRGGGAAASDGSGPARAFADGGCPGGERRPGDPGAAARAEGRDR